MSVTVVYRLYGLDETLLYVGMTNDLHRRLEQHSVDKSWFVEVDRIEVEQFGERHLAEDSESVAIWQEHPRYNVLNPVINHHRPRRGIRRGEPVRLGDAMGGLFDVIDPAMRGMLPDVT